MSYRAATSLIPAIVRQDPSIRAQPNLLKSMEVWWAGALWDPRDDSCDDFRTDFTCKSATSSILRASQLQSSVEESLIEAVTLGNTVAAEDLLRAGANATQALHSALRMGASPEIIHLLATWSDSLNVWSPEPVAVSWARCEVDRAAFAHGHFQRRGIMERLDAMLAAGADINAVGKHCETALHVVAKQMRAAEDALRSGQAQRSPRCMVLWHDLVARGADAAILDSDNLTALERLSRRQCTDLLGAKRNCYGMKKYQRMRLCGRDASMSWATSTSSSLSPTILAASPCHAKRTVGETGEICWELDSAQSWRRSMPRRLDFSPKVEAYSVTA